jgi:hypothetical protein
MTSEELDAMARELTGRQVENVRYYMLPIYGMTEIPSWDQQVAHATDYGIDLVTPESNAEFCCVTDELPWGGTAGARRLEPGQR